MPRLSALPSQSRMFSIGAGVFAVAVSSLFGIGSPATAEAAPVVTPGFTLSVFAASPKGSSKPDSLAVAGGHIWIAYGDGHLPDGSDKLSNEIVEYTTLGKPVRTISVKGHSDGLRLNPYTGKLWAIQNEDADPKLVVIDPVTGKTQNYTFPKTLHGGGYDDVAFIGGKAYISASNPTLDSKGLSHGPSIVEVTLKSNFTIGVTSVLAGMPNAVRIPFGNKVVLNLTDPDSLTPTPDGDLLMTDQGDAQLVLLRLSKTVEPAVQVLPLLDGVQVDDTAFVTAPRGYLLIADTSANVVYKLSSAVWGVKSAFSASTGVPAAGKTPAIPSYVGELDTKSGAILPAVTGLVSAHGLLFVGQPAP
jgi:hypothetical protein